MDTNARFIAVERIKFINAVDNVIKMVSLTPVRPVLNGVNFKGIKDDTRITLIATDSYRLGRKNVSISEPLTEDVDIIVPKEALSYIVSMMKNSKDEEVKLHLTGDYFVVYADGQYIQARLIDGKYPDVSRLIPDQSAISNKLLINRKQFMDTLGCMVFKDDKNNIMRMKMSEDSLIIENNDKQIGDFTEEFSDYRYKGEAFNVSCDVEYMKQAVKTFESEELVIGFTMKEKPFIIVGKDRFDEGLLHLLLPVRTYY